MLDYRWTTYVQRVPVDAGAAVFPAVRFDAVLVIAELVLAGRAISLILPKSVRDSNIILIRGGLFLIFKRFWSH